MTTIIFGIGQAAAQSSIDMGDMRFGLKAGLNINSRGGGDFSYGTNAGFHVGGAMEIPLGNQFSFQSEVLLSLQ